MPSTSYWQTKVAVVTGGSSGLGLAVARTLTEQGARVAIVGRDAQRLDAAASMLRDLGSEVLVIAGDVTDRGVLQGAVAQTVDVFGRLDLACHAAGVSMRGEILKTPLADFERLWRTNTLAAVDLAQQAAPRLIESRGHLVLIGSLATSVAPRFLGAYPTSKFPLAALAQQLRLELGPEGLHTLLVQPGPIARDDAGSRYDSQASDLPESLKKPGGGAKTKSLDPHRLAQQMLDACERRAADLILPAKARLLFAINKLSSRWGDWLVRKNTG
jgi:NAD(P)-dependent dehydrogenase (short-subunit alcohol dehydrogenase family)